MIQLRPVQTAKDWDAFIELPWKIYQGNQYWVPPLRIAVKDVLDVNKNPFFKHAQLGAWLAYEGENCVGRIVGVIDDHHNQFHEEKTAFFGFFEAVSQPEVAQALFQQVENWAKEKGMNLVRGPMNPSTNHECGLLVEGFEESPMVMMPYNLSYYPGLIEKAGYTKSKDLFAYLVDSKKSKFSEKLLAQAQRLKNRADITFRTVDMKNFDSEVDT